MIARRSPTEIAAMRRAGRVVAEMHAEIAAAVRPGVTTLELDLIGRGVLARRNATSNFLGYHGYPAVICASPNEVVVHGIPDGRVLDDGDIVSIDCGAIVDGWHADAAFTMAVGTVSPRGRALIEAADQALAAAIAAMVPGNRLGDVGWAVESTTEQHGFHVVDGYGGHGIGRAMHERPVVENYGEPGRGAVLRSGNTLCLEPMVAEGTEDAIVLADEWTVVTADGSWASHSEHTVLVTESGPEILTAP